MGTSMIPAERQAAIESYLKRKGFAQVEELSQRLDVSSITIRRDLDLLEEKGVLERSHGGAAYRTLQRESSLADKGKSHRKEKALIAGAVAHLVPKGETLYINSGSTTRFVIESLRERDDLRIVTNNVAAVQVLGDSSGPELILTGGQFRSQSQCLVGDETLEFLRRIFVDRVILGTDGLSLLGGLTSPVSQEAAVSRTMVDQCKGEVIVVADSSKLGRTSHFKMVDLDRVDLIVTDSHLDPLLREKWERDKRHFLIV